MALLCVVEAKCTPHSAHSHAGEPRAGAPPDWGSLPPPGWTVVTCPFSLPHIFVFPNLLDVSGKSDSEFQGCRPRCFPSTGSLGVFSLTRELLWPQEVLRRHTHRWSSCSDTTHRHSSTLPALTYCSGLHCGRDMPQDFWAENLAN